MVHEDTEVKKVFHCPRGPLPRASRRYFIGPRRVQDSSVQTDGLHGGVLDARSLSRRSLGRGGVLERHLSRLRGRALNPPTRRTFNARYMEVPLTRAAGRTTRRRWGDRSARQPTNSAQRRVSRPRGRALNPATRRISNAHCHAGARNRVHIGRP